MGISQPLPRESIQHPSNLIENKRSTFVNNSTQNTDTQNELMNDVAEIRVGVEPIMSYKERRQWLKSFAAGQFFGM
jgi:hypothetical protein